MKNYINWPITIFGLFCVSVGMGLVAFINFSPSTTTTQNITFNPPNIWELCQQAYNFPHPIPPELLPTEFREYWVQNHMFYVSIGGIHDYHNCVFTRSYEGNFEITVKKKEK